MPETVTDPYETPFNWAQGLTAETSNFDMLNLLPCPWQCEAGGWLPTVEGGWVGCPSCSAIACDEAWKGGVMGWSIGYDEHWQRDIGYGVPAWCDQPGCWELIDRGLSYVCGGEPYGGSKGCGLYFCGKHRKWMVCSRCHRNNPPFKPKPEHPSWLQHKATDPTWAKWREGQAAK